MKRQLLVLLMISLPLTGFAAGKIYTWTDDNGLVYYGDRPPSEVTVTEIEISGKRKANLVIDRVSLSGKWYGPVDDGGEVSLDIRENGSITFTQTRGDQSVFNYQGIWTLDDSTLTVITEFSQEAPAGGQFRRSVEPVQLTYNFIEFSTETMQFVSGPLRFVANRQ